MVSIFSLVKKPKFSLKALRYAKHFFRLNSLCWNKFSDKIYPRLGYRGMSYTLRGSFVDSFSKILHAQRVLNGANFFFVEATSGFIFLVSSQNLLYWNLNFFVFFGSMFLRFVSHALALLVQAGLVKPIRTAVSARYIAVATWLQVSPIPPIHV